jgi:hypothetical protein
MVAKNVQVGSGIGRNRTYLLSYLLDPEPKSNIYGLQHK